MSSQAATPLHREWRETSHYVTEIATRDEVAFSWHRVRELAAVQHDVVSLGQLVTIGISMSGARKLLAAGKLRRIHRGVYALGAAPLTANGHRMAAVLACGEGSVISHAASGAHLGLRASAATQIDVIAHGRAGRKIPGIRAHTAVLLSRDVTVVDEVPCTSVARTLLDLAAVISPSSLLGALEQAEIEGSFDLRAIDDVLDRNAGRRGAKRLRTAVASLAAEDHRFVATDFERRFLPIAARAGLGLPLTGHWVEISPGSWRQLDFYWPDLRLAVETDGDRTHGTRSGRRKDRGRDRELAAIGIQTVHYMWEELNDPDRIAGELVATAAQRRADVA